MEYLAAITAILIIIAVVFILVALYDALKRIKRIEVLEHFPPYSIPNVETKLKADGWISKEERVPEIGQKVLIMEKDEHSRCVPSVWIYKGDGFTWRFFVTHWMPLPEPPKQDEGKIPIVVNGACAGCGWSSDEGHASWCRTLKNTGEET